MKTLITGCTGLVGSALVEYLFKKGHSIQCLKRGSDATANHFWATHTLPASTDRVFDAVIHLAGENVAAGRWTSKRKHRILSSRVDGTRELVDYISMLTKKPKVFLCASAVGFYGNRGDDIVDEDSNRGEGFLADVCQQWEKETLRLHSMGIRTINLRFGMVLSPNGGALHKMLPAFRLGLGGVIGNGKQYVSWISMRDLVQIVDFIIRRESVSGPVNIVSPISATNKELTTNLAKILQRPAFFKVPSIMAKLIFGEMAEEMLLSSTRATPKVLMEEGYTFKDQSLDAVLRYCING